MFKSIANNSKNDENILYLISILWMNISKKRKKQFWLLLILMIITSLLEVLSIGLVLPFLGILANPEEVHKVELLQPFMALFQNYNPNQISLSITLVFVFSIVIAGLFRLSLLYVQTRFSYAIGTDLSVDIYRRTLYQNYSVHISRNSMDVINSIIVKTNAVIQQVLMPILILISSVFFVFFVFAAISIVNILVSLSVFIVFGGIYIVFGRQFKNRLEKNSLNISEQSNKVIRYLQEGLNGIREVIITNSQKFYYNLYRDADIKLRKSSGVNAFIQASPRPIIEMIGIVLISIFAYILSREEGGLVGAIPMVGLLVVGVQRILPIFQNIYNSYSNILGTYQSFSDVIELLNQDAPPRGIELIDLMPMSFDKKIQLKEVSFYHNDADDSVFKKINLTIEKGSCVGIIGRTGSGKSTLIDIIIGLFSPSSGGVYIDDMLITHENLRSWQMNISHVSQDVFLFDGTIEENIAFGINKSDIDRDKIKKSCMQAYIQDYIEKLPKQYETIIGERGARLSGGQKQRIGIARAFYRGNKVLILDEATSALDVETEKLIMEAIKAFQKDVTIISIAHRVSTLDNCDYIFEIKDTGIIRK
jgi:ATP-binding cassette, subfamily B, bacterial PglK